MLAAEENAIQIGLVHATPVRERRVLGIMGLVAGLEPGNTGIVYDDVELPTAENFMRNFLPVALLAYIETQAGGFGAKALGELLSLRVLNIRKPDFCAFTNEGLGDRGADAPCGSSYERGLGLQSHLRSLRV